jgi:hypothetical protein
MCYFSVLKFQMHLIIAALNFGIVVILIKATESQEMYE